VAITGGTGRYAGAGGEARVIQRDDRVVYKLRFADGKKKKGRHHH
jgi:hypothetical protein